jgi:hypothetical protein
VAGQDGILGFTVSAQGDAGATGLAAQVNLPPGVELTGTAVRSGSGFGLGAVLAQPFVVSGEWICLGTTGTITCTGPNVAPGGSTSVYLRVSAADNAAGTTPVSVTVSATGLTPVTVTGTTGVAAKGVSARYAGSGRLAVTEVGAPLLSCPTSAKGCADARAGRGDALNDDNWNMTYVDQDGDPSTVDSSVTNLTLDPSAEVVFAGLYWSGDVPEKAGDGTLANARLTDPTGVQTDVVAARVSHATASSRDVYQAFADVTDQVSKGGAGKWTFGGAALATGAAHYGGWTLVVVYGESSLPLGKVTVFEGFQSVNPGGDLALNVAGTAGQAARIGLVAWEGDLGISGDRMTLDGGTLTPTSGQRNANNIGDSTATGATDVNSFGVDAKPLTGATFTSSTGKVDASTATDVYLIGVVTVSPAG